jgi:histidyl-tRNA synthetase
MVKTDLVKGFKDFVGEEGIKRAAIRKILVEAFEKYGFNPVETPLVEYEEFIKGDNPNDEAVSDIFKLQDKGKRKLALRYEFTFQLKRLMQNKKLPFKRYQIGEVFRDEPVSQNRFRQFTQCDIDCIGSSVKDEAEILAATNEIMKKLGIKARIYFNNRKLLNEILDSFGIKKKQEVIREIDKLDKLSEKEVRQNLKKFGAEKVLAVFKKSEKYFEKFESYNEVKELKKSCKDYGVKIDFLPTLARGLSYYNSSVFEVRVKESKDSICGGGSYMFNEIQSTGISFGLDRLTGLAKLDSEDEKYLIVSLGEDKKAVELASKLRLNGEKVSLFYGKPSKALEYANSYLINKVVFVGAREVKEKKFKIKDMKSGKESLLKI